MNVCIINVWGYTEILPNFALWCATTGSGISREILLDIQLTSQLRALFHFHVYFTTRRILFEKGSIQSVNALPGEQTLNQTNNADDTNIFFSHKDFSLLPEILNSHYGSRLKKRVASKCKFLSIKCLLLFVGENW